MTSTIQRDARTYQIATATTSDLLDLVWMTTCVGAEGEGSTWNRNDILKGVKVVLDAHGQFGWYSVLKHDGNNIGQVLVQPQVPNPSHGGKRFWKLDDIYIEPLHRNRGLLRRLLRHAEKQTLAATDTIGFELIVKLANVRALRGYLKSGLNPDGHIVMRKIFAF